MTGQSDSLPVIKQWLPMIGAWMLCACTTLVKRTRKSEPFFAHPGWWPALTTFPADSSSRLGWSLAECVFGCFFAFLAYVFPYFAMCVPMQSLHIPYSTTWWPLDSLCLFFMYYTTVVVQGSPPADKVRARIISKCMKGFFAKQENMFSLTLSLSLFCRRRRLAQSLISVRRIHEIFNSLAALLSRVVVLELPRPGESTPRQAETSGICIDEVLVKLFYLDVSSCSSNGNKWCLARSQKDMLWSRDKTKQILLNGLQ